MNRASVIVLAIASTLALPVRAACPALEPILGPLACSDVTAGHLDYSGTNGIGGSQRSGDSYQCATGASETFSVVEDLYAFSCPFSGTVTASLTGLDCDLDLFVIDATCDPDPGCLDGSLELYSADEEVSFDCVAGDVYYLVVEGVGFGYLATEPGHCAGETAGYYVLAFDTAAGGACGEDCANELDDDGDGTVDCADPDCAAQTGCVTDLDGDGYDGVGVDATDCDDTNATVNPGATERCNGVDDDCDGSTDDPSSADASTWYADADQDGYGDPATAAQACTAPSGYGADATDCDDTDGAVNPGATERCNGVDDDCDGSTDDPSSADALTWYADADQDVYGDPATAAQACTVPNGYGADATDCDDTDAAVNPGATERCNGVDDDCDGARDDAECSEAEPGPCGCATGVSSAGVGLALVLAAAVLSRRVTRRPPVVPSQVKEGAPRAPARGSGLPPFHDALQHSGGSMALLDEGPGSRRRPYLNEPRSQECVAK